MNALDAAQHLNAALARIPTVPPAAWQTLLGTVGAEAVAALQRDDPFNARDQSILSLAHTLSRAGAHAGWVLAQAESAGRQQVDWLACARWHHDVHTALQAGWTRRPSLGSNSALPLEANQTLPTPVFVHTTEVAQNWITRLLADPLQVSAEAAASGLRAIPAGVWIAA